MKKKINGKLSCDYPLKKSQWALIHAYSNSSNPHFRHILDIWTRKQLVTSFFMFALKVKRAILAH